MDTTANDFTRNIQSDAANLRNGATDTARRARSVVGQEVNNLIADVQDLMARLASSADPEIARVRAKIERAIDTTKKAVADGAGQVQKQAKDAMQAGDSYVRSSPWQAVGIATVVGVVVGLLVARR
jgi:ElaB/YqjD/DUF883 family membrane-anchored ribosome-binding protein